ncbi:MAG: methyltransferase [Verrucomicrobia bacterium]|nr:MAG: methyltransferase [Verrucomicrobiota bacterium]
MNVLELLLEPNLRGVDLQGFERIALHADTLMRKQLIRGVFKEFYDTSMALDRNYFRDVTGHRIELGAGTSFFKQCYSSVISTDVQPAPHLDRVIDAQEMDLEDQSVRTLFCINCFHHFTAPQRFFSEVLRVVKPGGGCVIIDPYFGLLAEVLYKRLFRSESYDPEAPNWSYCVDPVTNEVLPNQALSYVVFFRDRTKFTTMFPDLEMVYTTILPNYLRYLLSGGLNFRQVIPSFLAPLLRKVELASSQLTRVLGLHHVLVLRRR